MALDMDTTVLLILLGLILWFWQDSLRIRERAREASFRACQSYGMQLLDDTVALDRFWLRWDRNKPIRLERVYLFEFTDTGATRRIGRVIMVGKHVEMLQMENGDLMVP